MRKHLTIALIFVASISVAQEKHPNHLDTVMVKALSLRTMPQYYQTLEWNPNKYGTNLMSIPQAGQLMIGAVNIPPASITITGNNHDIVLQFKKDGKDVGISPDWDIIMFKMKKSQFKWINDSTAVFIRK